MSQARLLFGWMGGRRRGKPGSDQYLAYCLRNIFPLLLRMLSHQEDSKIRPEDRAALEAVAQALANYDAEFFRKLANGLTALLKAREITDPYETQDPKHFLFGAYIFGHSNGNEPTKQEVIALAQRGWALARLTGCCPVPTFTYDPEIEAKIAEEIKRLPNQKWCRHLRALGLKLSEAERGRKKRNYQKPNGARERELSDLGKIFPVRLKSADQLC